MTARLHALEGAARLATHQYDFTRSTQLFTQSIAMRRALGRSENTTPLLGSAAIAARVAGEYEEAAALLEDALTRHRAQGDRGSLSSAGLGLSLVLLGVVSAGRPHARPKEGRSSTTSSTSLKVAMTQSISV